MVRSRKNSCTSLGAKIIVGLGVGFGIGTSANARAHDPFNLIVVDKLKSQIYQAQYNSDHIELKKSYHVTLGKARGDKVMEKDLKTPEGVYFFTAKLTPPSLKKKFGHMALMMNYPNPIDQLEGKTGYDIMLHSTDDPPRLKRDLDSEGCVVIDNSEIEELSQSIRLGLTPIIIYPELKPEFLRSDAKPDLKQAFQKWLSAWNGKDLDTYIGAYTNNFSYRGMDLKRYRDHKKSLNLKYAEIHVVADNLRFFYHPKYDVVSFTQRYDSALKSGSKGFVSSGTKMLYFVKDSTHYKIANESYSNLKED